MGNRLQISSITLKTAAGKEIELTLQEARDLHKELDEFFGVKQVNLAPVYIPPPVTRPYWYQIWCGNSADTFTQIAGSGLQTSYQLEKIDA